MPKELNVVAFDLETIANPAVIPFLPEIELDSRLKDPVKIKADNLKRELKRVTEMGLHPAQNLICCFGWWDVKGPGHIMLKDVNSEKDLLLEAWEVLSKYDHFVSFNGNGFDVPVLRMHSLINRVRIPVDISTRRYVIENHTDVRMLLANWETMSKGKLDFYGQLLVGMGKDALSGDQIQDYWDHGLHEDIGKYCEGDCEIVFKIFELMREYW